MHTVEHICTDKSGLVDRSHGIGLTIEHGHIPSGLFASLRAECERLGGTFAHYRNDTAGDSEADCMMPSPAAQAAMLRHCQVKIASVHKQYASLYTIA